MPISHVSEKTTLCAEDVPRWVHRSIWVIHISEGPTRQSLEHHLSLLVMYKSRSGALRLCSRRSCFTVSAPSLRWTPRECRTKGSRSSWRESMCDDQTLLCKIGSVCGIAQLQSTPSDSSVCKLEEKGSSRDPKLR